MRTNIKDPTTSRGHFEYEDVDHHMVIGRSAQYVSSVGLVVLTQRGQIPSPVPLHHPVVMTLTLCRYHLCSYWEISVPMSSHNNGSASKTLSEQLITGGTLSRQVL